MNCVDKVPFCLHSTLHLILISKKETYCAASHNNGYVGVYYGSILCISVFANSSTFSLRALCLLSLWDATKEEIDLFILEANRHHTTIKFTADISERGTNFLDTTVFKGERFCKESILDIRTHFKPTETFQYTHFSSCHAPGGAKGFIKGEALRLLRTNSSEALFEESINNFKLRLRDRGYPNNIVEKTLAEVKFKERKYALQEKQKVRKTILPFVTQYNPLVPNLKKVLMTKWHIIEKQPPA